ncbi:PRC-barrel domain-containing protein [Salinarimonas ramus]|uniref:PRC-barrel domain-containing protein n=1 Tax=Salinarimonas ramus TaxID=690164 RepID=A0A917VA42_9HYPH|nr:PRC-barrel domain-containing protein [Salinarimonas ramus]GGK54704.1 hypothetical protein GCM10011322_46860 [Salinarimonas ramus]
MTTIFRTFALASAALLAATAQPFAQLEPPFALERPNPIENQPGSPNTPRGAGGATPGAVANEDPALPFVAPPLDEAALYAGFRVEDLMGERLYGAEGDVVGTVRDLVIDRDGRVVSLVAESGGFLDLGNSYFRVPWEDIATTPGEDGVAVPIDEEEAELYDPFGDRDWVETGPREFRASEVIGDYVQLADQTGFGIVVDLVVAPQDGRLLAALVSRRGAFGGGLYAYPFTGREAGFDAGVERVELPYGSPADASRGLPADAARFEDPF